MEEQVENHSLATLVRSIPDFPRVGASYADITCRANGRWWLVIWRSALEVIRQLGVVRERRPCQRHGRI
jgi:hypothetical protein